MGRLKKTRYYHCSPKRITIGTILTPGKYPNFNHSSIGIFITTSPIPHFTIVELIEFQEINKQKQNWHVYEVSPIGKIYNGIWDDLFCESAEILNYIGNAKGLLNNKRKTFKARQWKLDVGSSVNIREVKDKIKGRGVWGGSRQFLPNIKK